MRARWTDFDRTFSVFDEVRRQMDRVWDDYDAEWGRHPAAAQAESWPRLNAFDTGSTLVVTADVPGLGEKDLQITLDDGVLSLRGERKIALPEGYTSHRRERESYGFSRSLSLPFKVDAEKTTATVKDGVLTVTLAKLPEAQPRQIAVRAQG